MPLTDAFVRNLRPSESKAGEKHADGHTINAALRGIGYTHELDYSPRFVA